MGAPDQLQIEVREEPDRVILRLDGELDMASAPLLRGALEQVQPDAAAMIVLDLERLRFIDSTGLRVILWAREHYLGRGQELAVTPGSPQVQRLLAVSGAGEHLRLTSSG